jgi:hypothetical protein
MIENYLHFPLMLCSSETKNEKDCKCFLYYQPYKCFATDIILFVKD